MGVQRLLSVAGGAALVIGLVHTVRPLRLCNRPPWIAFGTSQRRARIKPVVAAAQGVWTVYCRCRVLCRALCMHALRCEC